MNYAINANRLKSNIILLIMHLSIENLFFFFFAYKHEQFYNHNVML